MIVKTKISNLFAFSSFCFWIKYLERFFNCRIQKINTLMKLTWAFRLLQMIAGFNCSAHFVTLKNAIARYQVLASEEIIDASLDLSTHLYKVSLWTEHLELINAILQHFARAHFTLLIDEKTDLFQDRSEQLVLSCQFAVIKFIKTMMIKIHSSMKEWNSSNNAAERFAFLNVQRNLRRWRRDEAIWSIIQKRFFSLALLTLISYYLRVLLCS